jgi:hypothetical protein
MTTSSTARQSGALAWQTRDVASWLSLAASPTFALMAWTAAHHVAPMAVCTSGPSLLPIDGMTTMYGLMSLFHLSPWLRLASSPIGRAFNR